MSNSEWFYTPKRSRNPQLRLICFPYAGGNFSTYFSWSKAVPEEVEVVCVEPPGRGSRVSEAPYTNMPALVENLVGAVNDQLNIPFVIMGHGMGAQLGFELMQRLEDIRSRGFYVAEPVHFIASACRSPDARSDKASILSLNNEDYITALSEHGLAPETLMQHQQLLDVFLPLLRADIGLSENYYYKGDAKFNCPVSIFGGKHDYSFPIADLDHWQQFFSDLHSLRMFKGNHFFIETNKPSVLREVNIILELALQTINAQHAQTHKRFVYL